MPYKRRLENWDTFWYTCEFCRNTQVGFFHSFTEARRNKKSDANDANRANEREYFKKKQCLWTTATVGCAEGFVATEKNLNFSTAEGATDATASVYRDRLCVLVHSSSRIPGLHDQGMRPGAHGQ